MQQGLDLSALASVYPEAKNFVCFIHPQATYDAVAAALAFKLAAQEAGKSVEVVCEEPMRVEYSYLMSIDQVRQDVGNRDLVISFAYSEDQVDKVSYNVDEANNRFELVVAPKSGAQPLDPSTLEFRRSGMSADVVLLFGFHAFHELGAFYEKEKYTIDSAYTVAVTQNQVPPFAKLHIALQAEQYSYSEMVYFLIRQLQVAEVKDDIATNLLSGIEYSTERFTTPNMSARTFETIANLMRRGARRMPQNPAFQYLSMPIRTPENMNGERRMQSQGMGFQTSGEVRPTEPRVEPAGSQKSSQQVTPSEFARAMGSRS